MTGLPMTFEGRIVSVEDFRSRHLIVTHEAMEIQEHAQRFATLDEYLADREAAAGP